MAEIIALGGRFKNTSELQKYCDAQYLALQGASAQIKKLEEEVQHLKELLQSSTSLIESSGIHRIIKSPELAICEAQIEMFQLRALTKELTLEETKILDLLIKNKRLLSDQATTINGEKKKPKREYTEAELVEIAQIENKHT